MESGCPKCGATSKEADRATVDHKTLTALYHHDRGRLYRPTQQEQATGQYCCPYCDVTLKLRFYRKDDRLYQCPRCHWSIHRDDIWQPDLGGEPDPRENGDINDVGAPLGVEVDIGMADVIPPKPSLPRVPVPPIMALG